MARALTTYGAIKNGVLAIDNRQQFRAALSQWPDLEVEITVRAISQKRSSAANGYYFGTVVSIAQQVINTEQGENYTKNQIHALLREQCNSVEHTSPTGKAYFITNDTHELTGPEFYAYVERVRYWLLDFWGADTPDPQKRETENSQFP